MTRAAALGALRSAGFHNNTHKWVRVYVENNVSRKVADAEWTRGRKMREAGEPCGCWECLNPWQK